MVLRHVFHSFAGFSAPAIFGQALEDLRGIFRLLDNPRRGTHQSSKVHVHTLSVSIRLEPAVVDLFLSGGDSIEDALCQSPSKTHLTLSPFIPTLVAELSGDSAPCHCALLKFLPPFQPWRTHRRRRRTPVHRSLVLPA